MAYGGDVRKIAERGKNSENNKNFASGILGKLSLIFAIKRDFFLFLAICTTLHDFIKPPPMD